VGAAHRSGHHRPGRGSPSHPGRARHTLRQGKTIKIETEIVYALTSLSPEQASPKRLLKLLREHWTIENGQHYRRDRTQDEDRCQVRETMSARNLSLLRSLAIFLFEQQRQRSDGKKSLPDFERHIFRHWARLIRLLMPTAQK
jgi:predicted transposase YbfD/YdcC